MRKAVLLLIALPALIAAGIQASPSVGRSIQEPKQATKPADKPLEKEAKHVEGFAKECAVVTHHRLEPDGKGGLRPAPLPLVSGRRSST